MFRIVTIECHLQSQLEVQKGVSGFHDTQEELEKVSSVKSDLDEQKGKSLDEISDMVKQGYSISSIFIQAFFT